MKKVYRNLVIAICQLFNIRGTEMIQEILFSVILLIVYIVVFVLFACINALLNSIETKKNPTYCRRQGDIYSVHKYVSCRGGGAYEVYNFRRQENRWIYVKRKEKIEKKNLFIIVVGAIIFVIYLGINVGLISGLGTMLLLILTVWGLEIISRMVIIQKCKQYLRKCCQLLDTRG